MFRSRIDDMKFILEKIKVLELNPNYLNVDDNENELEKQGNKKEIENMMDLVVLNKKSHLFYFIPLLSEFITSKDTEIKQIVKELFKIIASEIGVPK